MELVLRPGFGPGSATREAAILDRTILPERSLAYIQISPVLIYLPLKKVSPTFWKFFRLENREQQDDRFKKEKVG